MYANVLYQKLYSCNDKIVFSDLTAKMPFKSNVIFCCKNKSKMCKSIIGLVNI